MEKLRLWKQALVIVTPETVVISKIQLIRTRNVLCERYAFQFWGGTEAASDT